MNAENSATFYFCKQIYWLDYVSNRKVAGLLKNSATFFGLCRTAKSRKWLPWSTNRLVLKTGEKPSTVKTLQPFTLSQFCRWLSRKKGCRVFTPISATLQPFTFTGKSTGRIMLTTERLQGCKVILGSTATFFESSSTLKSRKGAEFRGVLYARAIGRDYENYEKR